MPHPLTYPATLQAALFTPNLPPVVVQIQFEGRAKTVVSGTIFPVFSATYSQVSWDITNWLKARPVVTFQKPILPDGKYNNRISAGTLSLMFANPDDHFAAIGEGGILDPANIESGEISVRVAVGGVLPAVDLFRGRITQQPGEDYGETTIVLRDTLWNVLKTEMPFEGYQGLPGGIAFMWAINGILYSGRHDTGAGFTTGAAYASLLEDGSEVAHVGNGGGTIDLNYSTIKNLAPLGEYEISFSSPTTYTVSVPDGQSFHGSILNTLDTPIINLPPSAFRTVAGADPGDTITLQVGNNVRGNPVRIAGAMIEKGLLRNFGDDPGTNAAISSLPVVWSSFDALAQRFWGWELATVFTNENNDVFRRKGNNRPLSYLEAAQFLADHIGANILRDGQGQMYIQGPYSDNATIYSLDGNAAIISHRIESVRKYNYVTVQYGRNEVSGNFGSTIEFDLRFDPNAETEDATVSLPGYKIGDHVHEVQVASDIYRRRILNTAVRVEMEVTPQFGLTIAPGDRYYLDLDKQPKIAGYFEVYRVRTQPGESATVNLHKIEPPEGERFRFGAFVFGVSELG